MKKSTLIFALCSFIFSLSFALAAPSPVVQVISYKEPLGMYFSLQGWGSGSVIDGSGHILTNNHVVDDGLGGISDDFAICITEDSTLPPKCYYTASVIARDPDKDIALLKIDSVDIFGKPVNFASFTVLPIDYSYIPRASDVVFARGYPWVGANTITETQGIVSGTYAYNDNTYIKTDTLIAGGNSGGPLIREGKMVGVNTFLIGGFFDPALGYSLSIAEAQSFIQEYLGATPIQRNSVDFAPFLQRVTEAADMKKISDPLVTINFPTKYNVTTHIPGTYIDGQIAEESSTAVYGFSFMHFNTPELRTPEEIRFFLSKQSFFPFWQDIKFKTITIGGQSFYEVDTLGNTAGDKTKTQYVYFKIVNNNHLLLLQLATPFSNETTYDAIQKNITAFLAGISFPSTFVFDAQPSILVKHADVSIVPNGALADFQSNFFPYNGVISQFITNYQDLFTVRKYLSNTLWSYAQVSIVPNSFYTEGITAKDLLERLRESPYFSSGVESKTITYQGYEGFLLCDTTGEGRDFDEKNTLHMITQCEIILLVGEDNSHFLSLFFYVDKRYKNELPELMKAYLDSVLILPKNGITDFGPAQVRFTYTDVDDQSPEFRETLKYLLQYGILAPRPKFEGENPLTWEEYIRIHVWLIYHKKLTDHSIPGDEKSPTFNDIIKQIPVRKKAYVDSAKRDYFELMLRMRLAGVTLNEYSESSLNQFQLQAHTKYREEWKKIEDFEYQYFQGQKMGPNGSSYYNTGSYMSDYITYYNPVTGIFREPNIGQDPLDFGITFLPSESQKIIDAELECSRNANTYFSQTCFQKRQEYIWSFLSYSVLTKGQAMNALIPSLDFALWDPELAEKKTVKIESEN